MAHTHAATITGERKGAVTRSVMTVSKHLRSRSATIAFNVSHSSGSPASHSFREVVDLGSPAFGLQLRVGSRPAEPHNQIGPLENMYDGRKEREGRSVVRWRAQDWLKDATASCGIHDVLDVHYILVHSPTATGLGALPQPVVATTMQQLPGLLGARRFNHGAAGEGTPGADAAEACQVGAHEKEHRADGLNN